MSEAAIEVGDKVHIITRRVFEREVRRHFAGQVIRISEGLCRVEGFAFVFNAGTNEYVRRPELRTRLFSIGQDGFIVFLIPPAVVIESLQYRVIGHRLMVTDGADFSLDINEFGDSR